MISKKSYDTKVPTPNDRLFIANTADLYTRAVKTGKPVFTEFLDEHEQELFTNYALKHSDVPYILFGGKPEAARQMAGINCTDISHFPLKALLAEIPKNSPPLVHSAVLGSLMSLGTERAVIGDIVILDSYRAVFFCVSILSSYFQTNLTKIGSSSCRICETDVSSIDFPEVKTEIITASIASLRLDCIVAAMAATSREKATELIMLGRVFLNRIMTDDNSKAVDKGDVVVIRGKGKFVIDEISGKSKKGRTFVKINKYL